MRTTKTTAPKKDWRAFLIAGNALYTQDAYEDAIKYYTITLKLNTRCVEAWCSKGHAYFKLGKNNEAMQCYVKALEIQPRNAAIWCSSGNVHAKLNNHEEAIKCYKKSFSFDPKNASIWVHIGQAYAAMDKIKDAIISFKKAAEIDSTNDEYWRELGNIYVRACDYENALRCGCNAIAINANVPNNWVISGYAQMFLKEYISAKASFDKALEQNRKHCDALMGSVILAIVHGDRLLACSLYQQAESCHKEESEKEGEKESEEFSLTSYVRTIIRRLDYSEEAANEIAFSLMSKFDDMPELKEQLAPSLKNTQPEESGHSPSDETPLQPITQTIVFPKNSVSKIRMFEPLNPNSLRPLVNSEKLKRHRSL